MSVSSSLPEPVSSINVFQPKVERSITNTVIDGVSEFIRDIASCAKRCFRLIAWHCVQARRFSAECRRIEHLPRPEITQDEGADAAGSAQVVENLVQISQKIDELMQIALKLNPKRGVNPPEYCSLTAIANRAYLPSSLVDLVERYESRKEVLKGWFQGEGALTLPEDGIDDRILLTSWEKLYLAHLDLYLAHLQNGPISHQDVVSGLPNIGNSCYINAALQCLFNNRIFVQRMLEYRPPQQGSDEDLLRLVLLGIYKLYHEAGSRNLLKEQLVLFRYLLTQTELGKNIGFGEAEANGAQQDTDYAISALMQLFGLSSEERELWRDTPINRTKVDAIKAERSEELERLREISENHYQCDAITSQPNYQVDDDKVARLTELRRRRREDLQEEVQQSLTPMERWRARERRIQELERAGEPLTPLQHLVNDHLNGQPFDGVSPLLPVRLSNRFGDFMNTKLDVPDELIVRINGGNYRYRLTGFIVHQGSASKGHYVAYTKSLDENDSTWYRVSDKTVSESYHVQVRKQEGYVYFYSLQEEQHVPVQGQPQQVHVDDDDD